MRMDDRALGRFADLNPTAQVIHLDIDPAEHNKNIETTVPITGDVKHVLPQLTAAVQRTSHPKWVQWIDDLASEHAGSLAVSEGPTLTVQYVVQQIAEAHAGENDFIVVTGVGQHQMWAAQHMRISRPRQLITSGGLGTMGFEVPAALGAQIARPNASVWAICGDGGFQMTFQEIATMVDEQAPVKLAIMNNGYLGMVRQWQELFYKDNYVAVSMSQPDFATLAQAYGIRANRVTEPSEVTEAIREADNHPGPVLLDFRVMEDDNVWPMVPAGASLDETVETADELG